MKLIRIKLLIAALILMPIGIAAAQVPHIVGTWALDVDASDPREQIPQASIRTYTPTENGFLLGLWVLIDHEGVPFFLQFAAKTDGTDYPEYFPDALAALTTAGTSSPFSYSETQLDEYTIEFVDKYEGERTAWGTRGVSPDGQTMTIVANSRSAAGEVVTNTSVYTRVQ